MTKINTDKAYILGLIVGGGRIDGSTLQITLPYKKWGDLAVEPERAGKIAADILSRLNPILAATYEMNASYSVGADWKIRCTEITNSLKNDLVNLGLPTAGEMRLEANLKKLFPSLTSDEHKKRFMAGLVDTVGSLAETHRRFTDEFQIISFEFKGQNFDLVADVAEILFSLDCAPDQILWNHPNQHSGNCRYYKSWKKGFKIRVSLSDYIFKGTFVFVSKQGSATENKKKDKSSPKSKDEKSLREPGRITLHVDQNTTWLPETVRGGIYIHNLHFNCVLGMNAGTNTEIKEYIKTPEKYFCPFTCLTKDSVDVIDHIIQTEEYLAHTTFTPMNITVDQLLSIEAQGHNLVYGKDNSDGFPMNFILQGVAYVIAANSRNVKGKRVLGEYRDLLTKSKNQTVTIYRPNMGTCLKIQHNGFAALIGYVNDEFNKKLIVKKSGEKIYVREPKFEECVKL